MALTNTGLPLSESLGSLPIVLTATANPGTLIHTSSTTADDYVWLWLVNASTLAAEVRIYKGNSITGYSVDNNLIIMPKSNKILVEPGILTTSGIELRGFVSLTADSQRPVIIASGHVHRRIES